MRTTVILPDDLGERFKARAAAAGITQSDWIRDAIEAALISSDRSEHIPSYAPETDTAALREANDRATRAEADLAAAQVRIAVLEAEAKKDAEHIDSLQRAIATVATAPRPALPESTGESTPRPWWKFWK